MMTVLLFYPHSYENCLSFLFVLITILTRPNMVSQHTTSAFASIVQLVMGVTKFPWTSVTTSGITVVPEKSRVQFPKAEMAAASC